MLHTDEETTCPVLSEPGNIHLEGYCEDCEVFRLSRCTLGEMEDRYHTGRIGQDFFEAYRHTFAVSSPDGAFPNWCDVSAFPTVRRIVRKLLRARNLPVPDGWEG